MQLQEAWIALIFTLAGYLLCQVESVPTSSGPNGTFNCYEGNNNDITMGSSPRTCQSGGDSVCVELRWRNWETTIGIMVGGTGAVLLLGTLILHFAFRFFMESIQSVGSIVSCLARKILEFQQLTMSCGRCAHYIFDRNKMECRECSSDLCNDKFAKELAPTLPQLRQCYVSSEYETKIAPKRYPCPRKQSCSTGFDPSYQSVMVGCQAHCQKLNWTNCEYCDRDLCNNRGDTIEFLSPNKTSIPLIEPRIIASDESVSASSHVLRPTAIAVTSALVATLVSKLVDSNVQAPL